MMNRYLSLLVSAVAPACGAIMLLAGAHPIGVVALTERLPCLGLALLALTLAILFARREARDQRAEGAMWLGLAVFFFVAVYAATHLGLWAVVAALSLAATSVLRLVAGARRADAGEAGERVGRRLFA
jgi:predicted lysophospholipase L1 biosynthesis ABC-type transport system permease subunit